MTLLHLRLQVYLYGDSTHTIDTGTGDGNVTFGGAIQSGDHGDNDVLIIKSGTGDVTISGTIGLAVDSELGGLRLTLEKALTLVMIKMEILLLALRLVVPLAEETTMSQVL